MPVAVASASYDAANEQTAFAGATLTYDANGNLTSDGTTTYQWDARNRLASLANPASLATFTYDPLGRRTSKTINGVTSQFLYDGHDIAAEIGGGTVGANYLRSLNIDEPFIRQTSAGNEHYHTDALGSSLALSDASGASLASYGYEPFGKTTATGSSSNALQYTGRENDGTGLYYYRARYYSPRLQRFMGEDPLQLLGGDLNYYVYVRDNPLQLKDPMGLLTIGQGTGLGCVIGGLGGGLGARKNAVAGGLAGGALGCAFGPLIAPGIPLPPTPWWLAIGALTGGISGGLTAAAGGGTITDIGIGAVAGAIGGVIGNAFANPAIGAAAGGVASSLIDAGIGAALGP